MSMWEFEAFAEMAVQLIAKSDLPSSDKRVLMASAHELVNGFDVSFTHFRTAREMVDVHFLHRISLTDHPQYNEHKAIIDEMAAGEAKSEWLSFGPKNKYGYRDGPAEGIYQSTEVAGYPPGLWFDSTMPAWQKAVDAGLLTGPSAEHVTALDAKTTIAHLAEIAATAEPPAFGLLKMLHGMVTYTMMDTENPPQAGDAILASILARPEMKTALTTPQEDWIDERFDARQAIDYAPDSLRDFLKWWCAVYDG